MSLRSAVLALAAFCAGMWAAATLVSTFVFMQLRDVDW